MTGADREAAGQRIARARRRRGLSQAVLAGLIGRSESWLSQVERGKRGVDSHSVLLRLAEVLRVDIEEFTGAADAEGALDRSRLAWILLRRIQGGHPPFHRHADCQHPILPTWDYQLGKSVTLLMSYLLNL